ncbi:MAG: hypothetical protein ACFFDP_11955 [Promethearchaeota archaeon]
MSFGRYLRATLMILFFIPGFIIVGGDLTGYFWFFLFSLAFWVVTSWFAAGLFAHLLLRLSLWAEGAKTITKASEYLRLESLPEGGKNQLEKNVCLLLSEKYSVKPSGIIDMLDRAFFPTSLVIGIVGLYLYYFDFIGIQLYLIPSSPLFHLSYILAPAFASIVVIPIWLVNDMRARIFHVKTREVRRIGESAKNVINAVAGFGALLRVGTTLFIGYTLAIWAYIFFIIPIPLFFTTLLYLAVFHPKKVTKVEEVLESGL